MVKLMPNPALPSAAPVKLRKFDNRFNDVFVKFLFANEKQKEFLIDLLNAIFDERKQLCITERITDVTYADRELVSLNINEKGARLDVYVKTSQGQIIDVEFQSKVDESIITRDLFYFGKMFEAQLHQGASYDQALPIIVIDVLKENIFPKDEDYITFAGLTNLLTGKLVTKLEYIIFIEARKCVMLGESKNTRLIMWMNYLLSKSDQVIEALAKKDSIFQKVLDAERNFRGDTKMMDIYSINESLHSVNETLNIKVNSLENKNALLESEKASLESENASLESENASLKQEIQQTEARVKLETEARVKLEAAINTAKNMLAKGLPRSLVKEITELSDSQLAALS